MNRDTMLEAERKQKRERLYDSDHMRKVREAERGPKVTAESQRNNRQADERAEIGTRHRRESLKLEHDYQVARGRHLQSSRSIPVKLDDDHAREKKAMGERHDQERRQMADRHLAERHAGRAGKVP
jgi:hypothetical protein